MQKDESKVAGLEIFDYKHIPLDEIREVLHEALLLDETVPYASKRGKL